MTPSASYVPLLKNNIINKYKITSVGKVFRGIGPRSIGLLPGIGLTRAPFLQILFSLSIFEFSFEFSAMNSLRREMGEQNGASLELHFSFGS